MKLLLLCWVLMITSTSFAQPRIFSLERMNNSKITFAEIKNRLSCYPNMISHWVKEKGFSKKLEVKYGELRLTRTDVGDPDGNLIVYLKDKEVCEIELSLMPDIYYCSKDKFLLIYGYTGSNDYIELFSLRNECNYIGYADLNSKEDRDEVEINWYNQTDGSKTCHQ